MTEAHQRLREARERAGYETAKAAAEAMGAPYATYAQHESGERGLSANRAERYARFYRVEPEWLLYGRGRGAEAGERHPLSRPRTITREIPVLGEVAAGVWRDAAPMEAHDAAEWLPIDVPGYERAALFALKIVGTSMNKIYSPGRYVVVAPAHEAGLREGDYVIVQRNRGDIVETTCKEVVSEDGRIALYPRSDDPAWQTPLYMAGDGDDQTAPIIVGVVVADYAKRERPPMQLNLGDR